MVATSLVCRGCGHRLLQWAGRCPRCGAWDSVSEEAQGGLAGPQPVPVREVDLSAHRRLTSGVGEFDRVLGGGLVAGSIVLLAGEPGVGKSTLTLQAAAGYEGQGLDVVLVCGEESAHEVASRAARVSGLAASRLLEAADLGNVTAHLPGCDVAIIDSIQALRDPDASGEPGSPSQVRACAAALGRVARASGCAVVIVGHVTKDGGVAGPRTLEHLVDAVLVFGGEGGGALRTLRATKNRYGEVAEVGVFEMGAQGLVEVTDASRLFLSERGEAAAGSGVGCVLQGRRPVALEVQALVMESAHPRRVVSGVESSRVGVVAAVLERRAGVPLRGSDLYVSVPGGLRAFDRGLDLALALALAGARCDTASGPKVAAVGEVGLGGEVRSVTGVSSRMQELARLGFEGVLVPRSAPSVPGIARCVVADIREAVEYLG